MKKKSREKKKVTINGWFMWSMSNGRMSFARQVEPSDPFFSDSQFEENRALMTPIYVGYEGEDGVPLGQLLKEHEEMKKELEERAAVEVGIVKDLYNKLNERVKTIEDRKFWRRR